MSLNTPSSVRDTLAATMIDGVHAMAAVDIDVLRCTIHPEAVNREAVAEPPKARGPGTPGIPGHRAMVDLGVQ